jgi:hypothetical protein
MKKALIVGINDYPTNPLRCCVHDAEELSEVLGQNADGSANFDVKLIRNAHTRPELRGLILDLFKGDPEVALFYFSGHGVTTATGTYLVTPDVQRNDAGIPLDEILQVANSSRARNRIIILDCCHSGAFGNPEIMGGDSSYISHGITILAASREDEAALEINGHGVFTNLLLEALKGGAADLNGAISPASVYAYIDRALGPWSQRPVFKTSISKFISLRSAEPVIVMDVLLKITSYFDNPLDELALDPSFEETNSETIEHQVIPPFASARNVAKFKDLQKMQRVGLVVPVGEDHMYFAAMNRKSCKLTPLGFHYWQLIKNKRL